MAQNKNLMRLGIFEQPLLSVVQNHLISYPTPSNLTGNWNWGVLAGLCLVLQILTGIFLAMHYTAHVDYAFDSVQHLMRDVPNGWLLRYLHQNGQSLFFIVVYMHLFRGLYYTSYAQPREQVWLIGVVILLVMILTAFIGYVLPWGKILPQMDFSLYILAFYVPKIPAYNRIGPHNYDVLCFLHGALLSDAHAEIHGNGVRISFHHSSRQISFLYWIQKFLADKGYCNNKPRKVTKQIGKKGNLYYSLKFHTFTFASFQTLRENFYINNMKKVPQNISVFLSPLSVAVWIMADGHFTGSGLQLHTDSFSLTDVNFLQQVLQKKYKWNVNVQAKYSKKEHKYNILYIHTESMPNLISVVAPYIEQTITYKLGVTENPQFQKIYAQATSIRN